MKFMRIPALFAVLGLCVAGAGMADHIVRSDINGIDLLTLKTGVKNVVTIRGVLPLGDAASPESNPALAHLAASMLDKGTTTHDKFAIAAQLESVGASLTFGAGQETLGINGKCLAKDVPLVVSLIAGQLRTPAFSETELAKVKQQYVASLKQSLDDTDVRAADAFSRAIYPVGHPNRITPTEELIAAAERTTIDEVRAFHAKYYGPAYLTLVLVGDVDSSAVQADVAKSFAGWSGGKKPDIPAVVGGNVDAAPDQVIYLADKTNVTVYWGQATGLRYGDPDALALRLGTYVFGGGAISNLLMDKVRNEDGLTYGIYGYLTGDTLRDGDWRIWANFSPENLGKGIASAKGVLTKWHDQGITPAELVYAKSSLSGLYKVGLATTSGMATNILNTIQRGYDLTWLDNYPAAVEAITLDQVNQAIKTHLDPDKMVLIKAGTIPSADQQ